MSELERLRFFMQLLEMEVEALRSVIREYDNNPTEYLQMQKANAIQALINSLVRP